MFGDEEEHMHRHYHGRAWAALAISFALTASSAATGPTVSGPLGDRLDTYLTRLADLGFSGAVIVVKDGQVVLEKAYGPARRIYHEAVHGRRHHEAGNGRQAENDRHHRQVLSRRSR
jgi:CubicO group peptidase (beta-lactamase class C family)